MTWSPSNSQDSRTFTYWICVCYCHHSAFWSSDGSICFLGELPEGGSQVPPTWRSWSEAFLTSCGSRMSELTVRTFFCSPGSCWRGMIVRKTTPRHCWIQSFSLRCNPLRMCNENSLFLRQLKYFFFDQLCQNAGMVVLLFLFVFDS